MNEKPIVEMKGISKYFGGVTALENVDFDLHAGEVVGLAGDNGAGKSTLIKILSGVLTADSGEIFINSERVHFRSPREARDVGIETIYQNLALTENLNVSQNMFLGREIQRNGLWRLILDKKQMLQASRSVIDRLKIEISSFKVPVRYLSGGQRQAVAIGRAIVFDTRILIMDEPTAALGVEETQKVLELIKQMKKVGVSIIMICHNLEDLFAVADRIVVLKNGRRVGSRATEGTTKDEIVRMLILGSDGD